MSDRRAVDHGVEHRSAFDPLFVAYYDAVYRYCVRRLGRSDAEDAAADVFAVAWRRLEQMPRDEGSRAWLFGVAQRVVGNQYRSRRRRSRLSARLAETTIRDVRQADHDLGSAGEFDELLTALERLSRTDQELLRLSSWDGLTRTEIASVLGIKENAVDQRLHRARARLRARFDRVGSASPNKPKEAST